MSCTERIWNKSSLITLKYVPFAKVCFLEIRWTWWSRILCLKIEHFTFHLTPCRQGISLPQPRSKMKGAVSFSCRLRPHVSCWQKALVFSHGAQSKELLLQAVVRVAKCIFAPDLRSAAITWLFLAKDATPGLLGLNALQGLQSCTERRSFKLGSFSRRRRATLLWLPAGQWSVQLWEGSVSGSSRRAGHRPAWMPRSHWQLPPLLPLLPTPLSEPGWGCPRALARVCVCVCVCALLCFSVPFCTWICLHLSACCFPNLGTRAALIHGISSVCASARQLGTGVSLEQRRPVSCRAVLVKTCPICCFLSPFLSVLLTHAVWSAQLSPAVTSHFELPLLWLTLIFSLTSVKSKTTPSCPSHLCSPVLPFALKPCLSVTISSSPASKLPATEY